MRRCLICNHIGNDAAAYQLRMHLGCVAHQADGERLFRLERLFDPSQRFIEIIGHAVAIALINLALDSLRPHLDREDDALVHGHCHGLGAAHAAHAGSEHKLARQRAAEMGVGERAESLVGALQNALGADVDPRAGGHLAVHCQALGVIDVKVFLCGPGRHNVAVGDEHAGRVGMGFQNADGLARLHEHGFVGVERFQRFDDAVEFSPVARRASGAAVDDQLIGQQRHLGIEVVFQHSKSCFRLPVFGAQIGSPLRANRRRRFFFHKHWSLRHGSFLKFCRRCMTYSRWRSRCKESGHTDAQTQSIINPGRAKDHQRAGWLQPVVRSSRLFQQHHPFGIIVGLIF